MARPHAIVWFERFYLASLVLRVVVAVLNWATANPGAIEIALILALLLWFGVMYRHSIVSRWIIVLFFILTLIGGGIQIAAGGFDLVSNILTAVAIAMNALAVWHLLRADAEPWFAKVPAA